MKRIPKQTLTAILVAAGFNPPPGVTSSVLFDCVAAYQACQRDTTPATVKPGTLVITDHPDPALAVKRNVPCLWVPTVELPAMLPSPPEVIVVPVEKPAAVPVAETRAPSADDLLAMLRA